MNEIVIGKAKVQLGPLSTTVPRIDGPVLYETLQALQAAGMSEEALLKVKEQAIRIVGTIVGTFEANVAVGEVGPFGSGLASQEQPKISCPTGLLYGRVQSGKT